MRHSVTLLYKEITSFMSFVTTELVYCQGVELYGMPEVS